MPDEVARNSGRQVTPLTVSSSGLIGARRTAINELRLLKAGEELLRLAFARHRDGKVSALLDQLDARELSPHEAARQLLGELHFGGVPGPACPPDR